MNMKKILVFALSLVLVAGLAVGGTLAWITDKTDPLTNTFTVGNIDITLEETEDDFKMVPGATIAKDPVVAVTEGSESCYLFVKIDESTNLDYFITYGIADGWAELETGVYYRTVAADDPDRAFSVLAGDQVTVNGGVTKDRLDDIQNGEEAAPTLTFTAYAVQLMNGDAQFTPQAAWDQVKPTTGA